MQSDYIIILHYKFLFRLEFENNVQFTENCVTVLETGFLCYCIIFMNFD